MPDRVDALMHTMQTPGKHASSRRIVADASAAHLVDGDHPVLPRGYTSNQRVGWDDFSVHFTDKSSHPTLRPQDWET